MFSRTTLPFAIWALVRGNDFHNLKHAIVGGGISRLRRCLNVAPPWQGLALSPPGSPKRWARVRRGGGRTRMGEHGASASRIREARRAVVRPLERVPMRSVMR